LGKSKFTIVWDCSNLVEFFGTTMHSVVVNMVVIVTMWSKAYLNIKCSRIEPLKSKNMADWKKEK
jgi:hypothetical protein